MYNLLITGFTSAGVTSIVIAIINGLISRRKMAADTVQTIQATAGGMIDSLYKEIERLNKEVQSLRVEVSGVRDELTNSNRERSHVDDVLAMAVRYIRQADDALDVSNVPQPNKPSLLREHIDAV